MRPKTSPEAVRKASESKGPHHLFQNIVLEALVVLRELARERREVVFYRFHGNGHGGAEIAVLRHLQQNVIARRIG